MTREAQPTLMDLWMASTDSSGQQHFFSLEIGPNNQTTKRPTNDISEMLSKQSHQRHVFATHEDLPRSKVLSKGKSLTCFIQLFSKRSC